MDPPTAAHLGGPAANQASAPRQVQFFPVHFPSIRADDVHIKEPSQRSGILHIRGEFLDEQRVRIQYIKRLTAGHFLADVLIDWSQLCPEELLTQKLPPALKAPPDERRILDRAADVHGKADEGLVILCQQLLLVLHPVLPGIQHFG